MILRIEFWVELFSIKSRCRLGKAAVLSRVGSNLADATAAAEPRYVQDGQGTTIPAQDLIWIGRTVLDKGMAADAPVSLRYKMGVANCGFAVGVRSEGTKGRPACFYYGFPTSLLWRPWFEHPRTFKG